VSSDRVERKLAAILNADVVGYSRLMAEDEVATVRTLTGHREAIGSFVRQYRGRVVDSPGDNLLAEFPSATDAVQCAAAIQEAIQARNADVPMPRRMELRIGVHLGDVIAEDERLYGDGVNIAARLEALAQPGGICISGAVHEQVRNRLDLEYDDLGDRTVKNIPDPVHVYRVRAPGTRPAASPVRWFRLAIIATVAVLIFGVVIAVLSPNVRQATSLLALTRLVTFPTHPPLPEQPSIVVLPFANLSGDAKQEYFSDGITEDLTTALAGVPALFVISRNSAFTYKGQPVKVDEVGRDLGVRYVLEGSVQRAADRVRISAQLTDASSGFQLWSDRYDRDLNDIFALQSEISQEILAALQLQIRDAELERTRQKPTDSLTAYDLYLQAAHYINVSTVQGNLRGRRLLERAIELDSNYAAAYALLGATYSLAYTNGWDLDEQHLERGEAFVRKARELAPDSASGALQLANVLLAKGQPAEAIQYAEQATEESPNDEWAHAVLATALAAVGRSGEAVESIQRAVRLNPRRPSGLIIMLAFVHFAAGQSEEAIELFERGRESNPDLILARVGLAVEYERAGRHAEAQQAVREILKTNPQITTDAVVRLIPGLHSIFNEAELENLKTALRRAGLP
jgi:adenylate cyclase